MRKVKEKAKAKKQEKREEIDNNGSSGSGQHGKGKGKKRAAEAAGASSSKSEKPTKGKGKGKKGRGKGKEKSKKASPKAKAKAKSQAKKPFVVDDAMKTDIKNTLPFLKNYKLTIYWTRGDVGVERKAFKLENGEVQKKRSVAFLSKTSYPSATIAELVDVCAHLAKDLDNGVSVDDAMATFYQARADWLESKNEEEPWDAD